MLSIIDMPELTSIQLGKEAMFFSPDSTECVLILRSEYGRDFLVSDLWKLTSLTSLYDSKDAPSSFRNVENITLSSIFFLSTDIVDMPRLTNVSLSSLSFACIKEKSTNSISFSYHSCIDIGSALYQYVRDKPRTVQRESHDCIVLYTCLFSTAVPFTQLAIQSYSWNGVIIC